MTGLRCADVEARFVDAFDGRLDPAESVRFHSHIEGCAACRERAALWRGWCRGCATPCRPAGGDGDPAHAGRDRAPARGPDRRAPPRRWRAWWAPAIGLVAAAAAVVIWLRVGRPAHRSSATRRSSACAGGPAWRSGVAGGRARSGRRADGAGGRRRRRAGAGQRRRAVRRRPGRLALEGSARAVAVRLAAGKLNAVVAHRKPDETFAVITNDLRVEVRGTKFSVTAATAPRASR